MAFTRIRLKADLMYGASGTRKTTNIGKVAEYIWERYHKISRLVTLDGGGYDVLLPLVDAGILKPWVLLGRKKFTVSTLDMACQGYWPMDPDDPESPLVPPTAATWEQVGFYAFEGLTSIGDTIIRQLKADKAHLSQDPSYTYAEEPVVMEGGGKKVISYSGGNMSYFGFGQDQLYDFVLKTHLLPVEKVLWTALEGKGEEEGTRMPVFGPAIIGRKSTGKATQWFGNSVHVEQLCTVGVKDASGHGEVIERPVMYTRTHSGKDNIPFPCKHRAPYQLADKVPLVFDPPDMAALYRLLDKLNEDVKGMVPMVAVGGVGAVGAVVAVPELPKPVMPPPMPVTPPVPQIAPPVVVPTVPAPAPVTPPLPPPSTPNPVPFSAAPTIPAGATFVAPRISVKPANKSK